MLNLEELEDMELRSREEWGPFELKDLFSLARRALEQDARVAEAQRRADAMSPEEEAAAFRRVMRFAFSPDELEERLLLRDVAADEVDEDPPAEALEQPSGVVTREHGSPAHVALWEAINEFAFTGANSTGRQLAVVKVESAIAGLMATEPTLTPSKPVAETEALTPRQKELCREWLESRLDDMFANQDDGDQLLVGALKRLYAALTPSEPAAETDAWAVAVLDAWANGDASRSWQCTSGWSRTLATEFKHLDQGDARCQLSENGGPQFAWWGDKPAQARLAAARALVAADPTLTPSAQPEPAIAAEHAAALSALSAAMPESERHGLAYLAGKARGIIEGTRAYLERTRHSCEDLHNVAWTTAEVLEMVGQIENLLTYGTTQLAGDSSEGE